MNNPTLQQIAPLYSSLADDPDLGEIVAMFVEEMPGRIQAVRTHCDARDWENLRRTAHQIKGAAGSYGFDSISPAAGHLEDAIRASKPEEQILEAVNALVQLCRSCRAGVPSAESPASMPSLAD